MDNLTQVLDPFADVGQRKGGGARKVVTIVAVLALMGAALVIARDAGTSGVQHDPITNVSDADGAVINGTAELNNALAFGAPPTGGVEPQFFPFPDIQAIICGILQQLAASFPPFLSGIFNALLALFACASG